MKAASSVFTDQSQYLTSYCGTLIWRELLHIFSTGQCTNRYSRLFSESIISRQDYSHYVLQIWTCIIFIFAKIYLTKYPPHYGGVKIWIIILGGIEYELYHAARFEKRALILEDATLCIYCNVLIKKNQIKSFSWASLLVIMLQTVGSTILCLCVCITMESPLNIH